MKKMFLVFCLVLSACGGGIPGGGASEGGASGNSISDEEVVDVTVVDGGDVTGEPIYDGYVNEVYDFRVPFLEGFEVEYLPEDSGLKMLKDVKYIVMEDYEEKIERYDVEIGVEVFENIANYDDLASFVAAEYAEYSVEFLGEGVFVDQWERGDSIRSFYQLKDDVFYRAYLKLPSPRYNYHIEGFEEWLKGLAID